MPKRMTPTPPGTRKTLKEMSYEQQVIAWLMSDGWQVFTPVVDHGHKTDILISDGIQYFRIQIKTVEASSSDHIVRNQWDDLPLDCVIYFARNSNWGCIAQAFAENKRLLNDKRHVSFVQQDKKSFLTAFHIVDIDAKGEAPEKRPEGVEEPS